MNASETPLVSVVIPTYNHAHFLGRALQSVLDQTYKNWEAIVIDNHSLDNTDEIVHGFTDPRISLLKIHNNGVIAASRNAGIRAAKGEWVAFLDSDDLWYPRKLEIAISGIQEGDNVDICSTNEVLVDETTGDRQLLRYGPYCANFYQRLLVIGNCLSPSATLVRRGFINENAIFFREIMEFVTAEDYDFWLLLSRAGARFKFIDSVQGEYFIHANNSSGQAERHQQNISNVLREHVYQLQTFQPATDKLWRQISARLLLGRAKSLIKEKKFSSGVQVLLLALRSSFGSSMWNIVSHVAKGANNLMIRSKRIIL